MGKSGREFRLGYKHNPRDQSRRDAKRSWLTEKAEQSQPPKDGRKAA